MIVERSEATSGHQTRPSEEDQYFSRMMEVRTTKNQNIVGNQFKYSSRSFSQGGNEVKKRTLSSSYFGLESLVLLLCLTASLLILPLILPPLPPPPSLLLLVPICIFAVLVMLAFTPLYVHVNGSSEATLTTPSSFSQRSKI